MRIVCVGGGPAGLYFAIAAKVRDAGHDITVIERDPPGATYGWGVVYRDDLLDRLYSHDPESAREVRARSALFQGKAVRVAGRRTAYLEGYGFSIGRANLLDVLARRARQLGVDVRYECHLDDPAELTDADLVVAADGANSRVRQLSGDAFGTRIQTGRNPYIWLGTDKMFERFTFAFQHTPAGWIWFHAYPSIAGISTCIMECPPQTWHGLGLDALGPDDTVRLLEKVFATDLDGHALVSRARGEPARWTRFTEVVNGSWRHGNVVLVGDAAHTTHFTIGSGTNLAITDASVLARCLYENEDAGAALAEYERQRKAELHRSQATARASMAWFESVPEYLDRDVVAFAYAMLARDGYAPPWSYQILRASQVPALRRVQRLVHSGRRRYRARRRGE